MDQLGTSEKELKRSIKQHSHKMSKQGSEITSELVESRINSSSSSYDEPPSIHIDSEKIRKEEEQDEMPDKPPTMRPSATREEGKRMFKSSINERMGRGI